MVDGIQAFQEAAPSHIVVESTGSFSRGTAAKEGEEVMPKGNLPFMERLAQQLYDCLPR